MLVVGHLKRDRPVRFVRRAQVADHAVKVLISHREAVASPTWKFASTNARVIVVVGMV